MNNDQSQSALTKRICLPKTYINCRYFAFIFVGFANKINENPLDAWKQNQQKMPFNRNI